MCPIARLVGGSLVRFHLRCLGYGQGSEMMAAPFLTILGTRRAQSAKSAEAVAKYCSDRCKRNKPSTAQGSLDQRIQEAFVLLLEGKDTSHISSEITDLSTGPATDQASATDSATRTSDVPKTISLPKGVTKAAKGDSRLIVQLSAVETLLFANHVDPTKTFGRRKNRARRGFVEKGEWKSVDMVDQGDQSASDTESESEEDQPEAHTEHNVPNVDTEGDTNATGAAEMESGTLPDSIKLDPHIRPPQSLADVNGSIGGEKSWLERHSETPEELVKRRQGAKRAEERELVRCVARRGVVFGFPSTTLQEHEHSQENGIGKGTKKGKAGGKSTGKGGAKGRRSKDDLEDDESEADADVGKGKGEGNNKGRTTQRQQGIGNKHLRKCEAVMSGSVVEPSFAKGDWAIRWRED